MRAVLPALLLPLAVGCAPIGARTAPPGRGSDNSDSPVSEDQSGVRPTKIKDALPASIVVNQVGYFPGLVKLATVRTGGSSPQAWSLVDSAGHEVQSGQTVVADPDTLAGDTGMVALIRARPELVREVPVPGSNPDVDTPDDLAALTLP